MRKQRRTPGKRTSISPRIQRTQDEITRDTQLSALAEDDTTTAAQYEAAKAEWKRYFELKGKR